MTMPGFTADRSFTPPGQGYRSLGAPGAPGRDGAGRVVAQALWEHTPLKRPLLGPTEHTCTGVMDCVSMIQDGTCAGAGAIICNSSGCVCN